MTKNEAQAVVAIIAGALGLEGMSDLAGQLVAAVKVLQEPEPQKYPATVGGLVRLVRDLGVVLVRADAHSVTVDQASAAWTFPAADDSKPEPSDLEARRQRVWDAAFVQAEPDSDLGVDPSRRADKALAAWDWAQRSGSLPRPKLLQ